MFYQCAISGSRPGSTDGDVTHLRTQEIGLPPPAHQPYHHHTGGGGGVSTDVNYPTGLTRAHHPMVAGQHYQMTSSMPYNSGYIAGAMAYRGSTGGGGGGINAGLAAPPPTAPRIRALQNKLKMADINEAKGSLV